MKKLLLIIMLMLIPIVSFGEIKILEKKDYRNRFGYIITTLIQCVDGYKHIVIITTTNMRAYQMYEYANSSLPQVPIKCK